MSTERFPKDDHGLETATAILLIVGLAVSLAFLAAGVLSLYAARGSLQISRDPDMYLVGKGFAGLLAQVYRTGAAAAPGVLLMTIGIVVLILTPYARVVVSAIYFAWKRDFKYLAITLIVLLTLTLSLILH